MPRTASVTCFAALAAALVIPVFRANAAQPVQVQWEGLGTAVAGKTVLIAMPEGPVISGKAVGVTPDALLVDVKSTSDAKAYPKGPVTVPRTTLHVFQMQTKGKVFRIVGTVLGSGAGLIAGGLAAWSIGGGILSNKHDALAAAAFFTISGGGAAAGYLIGNAADKHWTTVQIARSNGQ